MGIPREQKAVEKLVRAVPLGKIDEALHFLEAADGAGELEVPFAGGIEAGGFCVGAASLRSSRVVTGIPTMVAVPRPR